MDERDYHDQRAGMFPSETSKDIAGKAIPINCAEYFSPGMLLAGRRLVATRSCKLSNRRSVPPLVLSRPGSRLGPGYRLSRGSTSGAAHRGAEDLEMT